MPAYDLYKQHRVEFQRTPRDCRAALNLSENFTYRYEKRLREELPPEEYDKIISDHSRRSLRGKAARPVESPKDDPLPELPGQQLGVLAEDFIYFQLRTRGFEVYRPGYPISGTDLLVVVDGRAVRIEVKCVLDRSFTSYGHTPNRKTGVRQPYEEGKVDVLIVLNLRTKDTLVIPTKFLRPGQCITISHGGDFWEYKDAYELLRVAQPG